MYQLTNGITGDIYQVCHEIWDATDEKQIINHKELNAAIDDICQRKNEIYGETSSKLSPGQKKILQGIVLEKGKNIISTEFVKKYKISSRGTVQTAMESFYQKNFLYKKEDQDWFYDPFFYIWLKKKYAV